MRDNLFRYIRTKKKRPIGVLVAAVCGDKLLFGFSSCHTSKIRKGNVEFPGDKFVKERGRNIALGRARAYEDAILVFSQVSGAIPVHPALERSHKNKSGIAATTYLKISDAVYRALPHFIAHSERFFQDKKTASMWVASLRFNVDEARRKIEDNIAANALAKQ